MKRVLSFLLALVLTFSMIPSAFAAEDKPGIDYDEINVHDFTYTVENGGATITGYTGNGGNIMLPSELGGYPVTTIGDGAFYNCDSLISVFIPDSVTNIGSYAFTKCDGLTNVTIPDSVTEIDQCTFEYCSKLCSISIPDSVMSIGVCAFRGCSSLIEITLGRGLANIGQGAIWYCDNLKNVYYHGTEEQKNLINIDSYNDDLLNATWNYESTGDEPEEDFVAEGTCGDNLTWLFDETGTLTISGNGPMEDYGFADENDVNSYVYPPWEIFKTEVTDIVIENGVTSIGAAAFSDFYNLTSVTVGGNIATIGDHAFYYCNNLTEVNIGDSVTEIGAFAFAYCEKLTSLVLGSNVAMIDEYAFFSCTGLTSVVLPDSVTTIGECAFGYCTALKDITIGDGIKNIGKIPFDECEALTNVYISDVAAWCNITFADLMSNPLYYAENLYLNGELLTELVIPESVTTIGNGAFFHCTSLISVEIPDSITAIGNNAFEDCSNLISVNLPSSIKSIGDAAFAGADLRAVTIPDGVTNIADYAFYACRNLSSVTIPDGVTSIGSNAFFNCLGLTSVVLPDSVTSIGVCAFQSSGLTEITIPEGVETITEAAFAGCDRLASINIPVGVTTIADGAFYECVNLKDIYYGGTQEQWKAISVAFNYNIPLIWATKHFVEEEAPENTDYTYTVENGEATITGYTGACGDVIIPSTLDGYPVVALQDYAFSHNVSLTSVVIPDSVTRLGEATFEGCEELSFVTLPSGLEILPQDVFANCTDLESINLPATLTTIGQRAFRFCTDLSSVTIPACVTEIGRLAFDNCDGLNGIWVDAANANYCSDDKGVLFNKTLTDLIWAPQSLSGLYEIPATVTTIHQSAFEYSDLEAVTIPDGVITIDREAFNGCNNLFAITIPDSVTTLGYRAVANNDFLQILIIGNGLNTLSEAVFYGNPKLTSVAIPNGVTTIGPAALAGCASLKTVTIPASVTFIDAYAFASPVIAEVYYGGTQEQWDVISVGEGNEYLLNATLHVAADREFVYEIENGNAIITGYEGVGGDVEVPAELDGYRVTAIGKNAFRECYTLNSVVLPDSVTAIGVNAFWDCRALKSVKLPAELTTIDDFAFYRCESLEKITIPNTVTKIGDYAFQMCWSLTEITIPGSVKQMYEGIFSDCINLHTAVLEEGVTTICAGMFSTCKSLKSVTIPKSVTAIKYIAFASCDSLTDIYYKGSKEQWNKITINADNSGLDGTTIHYAEHTHKYSKGKCTVCGYKPAGAKITTQPVNIAVASGKTAKVTIKATGTGLKYTWYYAKKSAKTYTKASSTTNSYSLKMSSSYDGTKVYCVVSDSYGNSVKSSVVTLYKGTPAKITTQPKGITVASGKTGKLELKASGSSLKYTWYIKYKGTTSWTKVGSSSKSYSFKMASKLNGAQAYCVVKDKYGISVKSSVVTIKQAPVPKVTTQPKSVTQVSGKTASFSVKASGEGLKYQWYYAKKGSSSFKKVSGAKSATYSVKVSSSVSGRKYYCLVTDKYGQTVKSSAVTLTMKTVAKITTQPKSVTVKNGKTAKVTIKAVGDGLKYTWYYLKPGATKYVKATATGASYSVKMAAAWKNAKVYCVIADKYGNTVKSSVVSLKMK